MSFVAAGFALAILIVGILGLVSPEALMSFVRRWQTPAGMLAAAGFRIAFGVAAWLAAPSSRAPVVLQVLGVVSVLSGIAIPSLGRSGFAVILAWWERRSAAFRRAWAGVAAALGGFVLWSVTV